MKDDTDANGIAVIRSMPPAYGVCRADGCRKNLEWVTTLKGKKVPLSLPVVIQRVYERHDGTFVSVVNFNAVHWSTCSESRARVATARASLKVR